MTVANAGRLLIPADLQNHRFLGFSKWFDDVSWELADDHTTERIPLKPWLGINDYAGVITAAVCGMGVAEIPFHPLQAGVRSGLAGRGDPGVPV